MKKFFLFLLILILIAVVGYGGYRYFSITKKSELDNILPAGPLGYLKVNNGAQLVQDFVSTKFWQTIKDIDIALLMQRSGQSRENVATYQVIRQQLSSPYAEAILKKFLGREFAAAVYPMDLTQFNNQTDINRIVSEILSKVFFITRLDPEVKFLEIISGFFNEDIENLTIDTIDYRDKEITHIDLFPFGFYALKLYYVRIGDYLVMGFHEDVAKTCLDVMAAAKRPLSDDPGYLSAKEKFLVPSHKQGYINLEVAFGAFKQLLLDVASQEAEDPELFKQRVQMSLSEMEAYKSLVYSVQYGGLTKMQSNLLYDKNKMSPDVQQFFSCAPKHNNSINFVPRDVLMYQWFDCYDFSYYLKKAKEQTNDQSVAPGEALGDGIANLRDALPMIDNIEKNVIGVLGQEVGWYLYDINLQGPFPLPILAAFVKIVDLPQADNLMRKLTEQKVFIVQTMDYKDTSIKYFNLPLGTSIQPGYVFLGDYLLVGMNTDLIIKSVDAFKNSGESLLAKDAFKEVDRGLTDDSNGVFFLESAELIKEARSIFEWGGAIVIDKEKQKQAYMQGSQKRLADLSEEVAEAELNLEMLENKLEDLQSEKRNVFADELRSQEIQSRIERVEILIGEAENTLAVVHEKAVEQQRIMDGFADEKTIDPDLFQLYLNEAVYPILEGLEYFRVVGATMSFGEDEHKTTVFLKSGP